MTASWVAGVDPTTKRFPAAVEAAMADAVVAPAAAAAAALRAPKTAVYLPPPNAFGADQTAEIQAIISGMTAGQCLVVGDRYRVDGQLTFATPNTGAIGSGQGEFYSLAGPAAQKMINVTASNVTLRGFKVTGPQFAVKSEQYGIYVTGTDGTAPITNLVIDGMTLAGFGKYGVLAVFVTGFKIDGNTVSDCAYAGIGVLSCADGTIDRNKVRNITQPTGYSNSYGIYTSRNTTTLSAAQPRSRNISISNNFVADVPNWDGINTHAGQTHTIANNVVRNCKKPIEVVGCPAVSGAGALYAPLEFTVIGNTVDATVTDGSAAAGILFVGADIDGGVVPEYATGSIIGNTIRGHGLQSSSINGAITAYQTRGLVISGNVLIEPSPHGVYLYRDNIGAVVAGNTVIDPWTTDGALATAVTVGSDRNTAKVDGNSLQRGTRSATIVANRGIYVANLSANAITLGANDMAAATTPVYDAGQRIVFASAPALSGTLSTRPAASSALAGATYLATDVQGGAEYRCVAVGTVWSWVQTGAGVTAGAGSNPGAWVPADNGLVACDADPLLAASTLLLPSAGVTYVRKMKVAVDSPITNVLVVVSSAGAGLSNAYLGVFDSAGAQLGTSADVSTTLQSTGFKTVALTSPTTSRSAGSEIYAAVVVGAGTTMPTFRAFAASGAAMGISTPSKTRWGSIGSGLTALQSSFNPAGVASLSSASILFGLS